MNSTVMDDRLFERQVAALEAIAEHLESLVCETELCRGAIEVFTRQAQREERDVAHLPSSGSLAGDVAVPGFHRAMDDAA